ncbi:hypothetical protein RI367_004715 [Sorochytrium milnesiophthora]
MSSPRASSPTSGSNGANNSTGGSSSGAIKSFSLMLDTYHKARLQFAQSLADFAARDSNLEHINAKEVLPLIRPLLTDAVPGIQHAAALALGRLANYSEAVAWDIVDSGILPHLVFSIRSQNRFYKKSATFVLRAIGRHSVELAQAIADAKGVDALMSCLEDFDPGVKESAGWAIGYIARHSQELATAVVDAGAIPLLVVCIQEPELSLRRIAASALGDISKHSPELAQCVVDGNAIPFLAPLLATTDSKLKRQICLALSQIAKHTVDLAESVVDGDIFPNVLHCFRDADGHVRRHAATLLCEIAKHSPELAQLVVNSGGVAAVVDYINDARGSARLPGIMTLGYIAAFSETLALSVIVSKGVPPLADALSSEPEEHVKAACAWSLGQIGRHSSDHAKTLSDYAVLPKLLKVLTSTPPSAGLTQSGAPGSPQKSALRHVTTDAMTTQRASSSRAGAGNDVAAGPLTPIDDLRTKTKRALKCILEKTLHLESLDPLVQMSTPPNILRYVLAQFAKILPHDIAARRAFVTTGCLQRVQEILAAYKAQSQSKSRAGSPSVRSNTAGGSTAAMAGAANGAPAGAAAADQDKESYVGSKLYEHIRAINECYPEEIVRYYSPGYSNVLLGKIEEYGRTQGDPAAKNKEGAALRKSMKALNIESVPPLAAAGGGAPVAPPVSAAGPTESKERLGSAGNKTGAAV